MAVALPDPLIPQLAEALGLDPKRCRSIDLHMRTNDVLTVTATEYIDVEQAGRIIQLMRSRDYALVPREHYDRLVRHVEGLEAAMETSDFVYRNTDSGPNLVRRAIGSGEG